jgi:4,5-DOPA dioxygenase extradiol
MSNEPRCEVQPVLFVACGSPLSALGRPEGEQAHPTPEHFLPLLYALGASSKSAPTSFPIEGFDHSLSMRSVRFG